MVLQLVPIFQYPQSRQMVLSQQIQHQKSVDNDATTRWSNEGLGSWIRLDLGSQKTVCSVNISWYNGNKGRIHLRLQFPMMVTHLRRFSHLKAAEQPQLQKNMMSQIAKGDM